MIKKLKWSDPTQFQQFVGKKQITDMIAESLKNECFPQFMTFDGPTGSGKTTFANVVAHRLVCANALPTDFEPCGECHACQNRMIEASFTSSGFFRLYNCSLYGNDPDLFLKILRDGDPPEVMVFDELQDLAEISQKQLRNFLDRTDRYILVTTTHFKDLNDALKNRLLSNRVKMTYPTEAEIKMSLTERLLALGLRTQNEKQVLRIMHGYQKTMRPLMQFPEKAAAECPGSLITDSYLKQLFGDWDKPSMSA